MQQGDEMASTSGARIVDLPEEVLVSIFSFLPVADMARCAAICEQWHRIVTGCIRLWKGKGKLFMSNRSPEECAETRAVLNALPPFQEVFIEPCNSFMVSISYPHIRLWMINIGVIKNCPIMRCDVLSTTVAIAGDILSYRTTIDFKVLRYLRLNRTWTPSYWVPKDYRAEYVIQTALDLCPNLRHLSVYADTLLADKLNAVEGLGRLRTLEMACSRLRKLTFLRHCSALLEELRLGDCRTLPSCELRELRQLQNLRWLRLSQYNFEDSDLLAAVVPLVSLEWMELHGGNLVSDLSFLQHCERLTEVRFTNSSEPDPLVKANLGDLQLHDLRLPINTDFPLAPVDGVSLTADDVSAALYALEHHGLPHSCLVYLSKLRHCTQLRHICFEFVRERFWPEMRNVRIFITLTGST